MRFKTTLYVEADSLKEASDYVSEVFNRGGASSKVLSYIITTDEEQYSRVLNFAHTDNQRANDIAMQIELEKEPNDTPVKISVWPKVPKKRYRWAARL